MQISPTSRPASTLPVASMPASTMQRAAGVAAHLHAQRVGVGQQALDAGGWHSAFTLSVLAGQRRRVSVMGRSPGIACSGLAAAGQSCASPRRTSAAVGHDAAQRVAGGEVRAGARAGRGSRRARRGARRHGVIDRAAAAGAKTISVPRTPSHRRAAAGGSSSCRQARTCATHAGRLRRSSAAVQRQAGRRPRIDFEHARRCRRRAGSPGCPGRAAERRDDRSAPRPRGARAHRVAAAAPGPTTPQNTNGRVAQRAARSARLKPSSTRVAARWPTKVADIGTPRRLALEVALAGGPAASSAGSGTPDVPAAAAAGVLDAASRRRRPAASCAPAGCAMPCGIEQAEERPRVAHAPHRVGRRADQRQQRGAALQQIRPAFEAAAGDPALASPRCASARSAASTLVVVDAQRAGAADRQPLRRRRAACRRRRTGRARPRSKPSSRRGLGQHARGERPRPRSGSSRGDRSARALPAAFSTRNSRATAKASAKLSDHRLLGARASAPAGGAASGT